MAKYLGLKVREKTSGKKKEPLGDLIWGLGWFFFTGVFQGIEDLWVVSVGYKVFVCVCGPL